MTPRILSVDAPEAYTLARDHLRTGQPVAFPTDTVYGIGVPALHSAAILRLYAVKRRPHTLAIPVLIADMSDLAGVAHEVPSSALDLAQRHWPGALSLIVPAAAHLPADLLAHGTSVAIRMPDHDWLRQLIRLLGEPLAATSANRHGAADTTTAPEVVAQLGSDLSLVIDGGVAPGGIPSTLIDCTGPELRVVRQGGIRL